MIRKTITLLFTIAAVNAMSQTAITITNADMPKVNDTLRYSTANASTYNFLTTGTNYNWDFSGLKATAQELDKYSSPLSGLYVIYFASATYGVKENNLSLGALLGSNGLQNVMGFYKNTAGASVMLGRGVTYNNLPLGLTLSPKDTVYKFPLTYGKRDSCSFEGSISLATIGGFKQKGYRITTVDGWGTIKTPYGQFACIRIKSVINEVDSISASGFNLPIPNSRTEYKWLAKGEKFPILEAVITQGIGGVGATTTIRYKDIYRPELFINNADFNASKTVALTTDTINLISLCAGSPTAYTWSITPNTFTYEAGTTAASQNPRVLFKANGKYSIKLQADYTGGTDDTLKINYITIGSNSAVNKLQENTIDVNIFPIPTSSSINVHFSNSTKKHAIVLYDILGKVIDTTTDWTKDLSYATINLNEITSGIYFIKIDINGQEICKRIIKE